MTHPVPEYLRLYRERPDVATTDALDLSGLDGFFESFEAATGWRLRFVAVPEPKSETDVLWCAPVNPGAGISPGHLRIEFGAATETDEPPLDLAAAGAMARGFAATLEEMLRTRHWLRRREAELAGCVPLVEHPEEQRHLADRLEAVLRGGADVIGASAAALYLLDDATTQLRTTSAWNVAAGCFSRGPRPLADAKGDLEALLGHAVTLRNASMCRQWNAPEEFSAAVCVPVSSPTMPLGTLWLFSQREREFSDHDVHVAELVAGRLAADLDREVLLKSEVVARSISRQLEQAQRLQQEQLPAIAPLIDGWEVAGWTEQAAMVGGALHDWWIRGDGRLMLLAGDCLDGGIDSALCAAALRATLRAAGLEAGEPNALLEQASQALWTGSAGDQFASLFCAAITPSDGRCDFAAAGQLGAMLLGAQGFERLTAPSMALGTEPGTKYLPREFTIVPGQTIVIVNDGVHDARDAAGRPWTMSSIAEALGNHLQADAETLVDLIRDRVEAHSNGSPAADRTILVVKRRL
ncbi:MAG TPA: SpoIIE family protein phosphatase [Pirellulales bacterium]|nr:SpoIIE family protein phosphatase [Pirellulales bacterium]